MPGASSWVAAAETERDGSCSNTGSCSHVTHNVATESSQPLVPLKFQASTGWRSLMGVTNPRQVAMINRHSA